MTVLTQSPSSASPSASSLVAERLRPRVRTGAVHAADVAIGAAGLLWLLALRWIDVTAMNDYGLVAALPVAYFAAVGLLLVAFALELGRSTPSPTRLALVVVALVVVLHGTVAVLFPLPHYSWVYKHLGVVRMLMENGRLSPRADIYQSWPGFFAAGAWLSAVAGVHDPTRIVAWAQVVFNLVVCAQLLWLYRVLGVSARVRWTAMLLFVLGNWVSQDYFAPQALAYSLAIAVFTVVFAAFRSSSSSPSPSVAPWVRSIELFVGRHVLRGQPEVGGGDDGGNVVRSTAAGRGLSLLLVLALFSAVVVSHPLTPYMLIASIGLLTVMGVVRPRWLIVLLVAETVLYMAPRYDFVASHYGIFHAIGSFFTNAQNNAITTGGEPGRLATASAARYLSLVVWALAAVGAVARLRRGAHTSTYVVLVVAPVFVLLAQNYGGEAIFRVYLFALPWSVLLAADFLARLWDGGRLLAGLVLVAVGVGLGGLFVQAYFGSESVNRTWPTDVAAATYFYDHAPDGSILVLAAPNFPTRDSAGYDRFLLYAAASDPNLMSEPALRNRVLDDRVLPAIESSIRAQVGDGREAYLVIGVGERVFSDTYRLLPPGSLDALDGALTSSPRWRVFFRSGDSVVYRLVGGGS
jgi:hypothetical protein